MASSFFGGSFFGGEFFNEGGGQDPRPRPDDGGRRGRNIYKPLGLPPEKRKKVVEGRKTVIQRVDDTAAIQAEIAARLAREFGEQTALEAKGADLTEAQRQLREERARQLAIDAEIGYLLRKKLRTEEDEIMLLMLIAAASC